MAIFKKKAPAPVSLEREVQQAEATEQFARHPVVQELMDRLRTRYIEEWEAAGTVEGREAAGAKMRVLRDLQDTIDATVDRKVFAQAHLTHRERQG